MRGRYTGASTQKVTTQTNKQKYPYMRCYLKQLYWVPYYLRFRLASDHSVVWNMCKWPVELIYDVTILQEPFVEALSLTYCYHTSEKWFPFSVPKCYSLGPVFEVLLLLLLLDCSTVLY